MSILRISFGGQKHWMTIAMVAFLCVELPRQVIAQPAATATIHPWGISDGKVKFYIYIHVNPEFTDPSTWDGGVFVDNWVNYQAGVCTSNPYPSPGAAPPIATYGNMSLWLDADIENDDNSYYLEGGEPPDSWDNIIWTWTISGPEIYWNSYTPMGNGATIGSNGSATLTAVDPPLGLLDPGPATSDACLNLPNVSANNWWHTAIDIHVTDNSVVPSRPPWPARANVIEQVGAP